MRAIVAAALGFVTIYNAIFLDVIAFMKESVGHMVIYDHQHIVQLMNDVMIKKFEMVLR